MTEYQVIIYQPERSVMQSRKRRKQWLLQYDGDKQAPTRNSLTGSTKQQNTKSQIKLWFDTCEAAVEYAKYKGLDYHILENRSNATPVKSYASNFAVNKLNPWTH